MNIFNYFYSCPYCGDLTDSFMNYCLRCHNPMTPLRSKYEKQYYADRSKEKYNVEYRWKEFVLEEAKENPLFDEEKSKLPPLETMGIKTFGKMTNNQSTSTQNIPKCPTCGSTNIHKISDINRGVHALAFGLFSKTARSQFECNDCGYKW